MYLHWWQRIPPLKLGVSLGERYNLKVGGRVGFADNPLKNFVPGSGPGTGSAVEAEVNIKKVKKALNSIKKQRNKKQLFEWSEKSDWYKKLQKDLGGKTPLSREYTNLLINKTVNEYFPNAYHGKTAMKNFRNDMVVNSFINHLKQVGEFDGQEKFAKVLQQFEGVGDHKYEQINKAWKSWIAGEFEVEGIDRKQLKKELKARGIDYSQIDNWSASAAQKRGVTKIEELKWLDNQNTKFPNRSADQVRNLFNKKYPGSNFYYRVSDLTHLKNTGKYISGDGVSKPVVGIKTGERAKWLKDSFGLQFQGNYSKMIKTADQLAAMGETAKAERLYKEANKFFGPDGIITKAAGEGEHALARSFDLLNPDHQLKINSLVSGDLNQFKKWNFDIPVKRYFDEYNLPGTTKARKKELAKLIEERRSVLNSLTGGDKKGMVAKGVVDFKYGNTITATSDVIPIDKIKNFKVEDLLIKGKGYEEAFLKVGQKAGLVDKKGIKSKYVEMPIKTKDWDKVKKLLSPSDSNKVSTAIQSIMNKKNSGLNIVDIAKWGSAELSALDDIAGKLPSKALGALGKLLKAAGIAAIPLDAIPFTEAHSTGLGTDVGAMNLAEIYTNLPGTIWEAGEWVASKVQGKDHEWKPFYEATFGRDYETKKLQETPVEVLEKNVDRWATDMVPQEDLEKVSSYLDKRGITGITDENVQLQQYEEDLLKKMRAKKALADQKKKEERLTGVDKYIMSYLDV